ncbi:hypothetical protein EVAR_98067_1 [Eumeta japonica]|uniref:Uncharacterized protein n=1 Tax=Eumeta variegata TaxID=151549 RepID=A0A4C1WCV4_EUMVA|nr:hypothetical protein EVAR_98067_1 [Eumeta japonica]
MRAPSSRIKRSGPPGECKRARRNARRDARNWRRASATGRGACTVGYRKKGFSLSPPIPVIFPLGWRNQFDVSESPTPPGRRSPACTGAQVCVMDFIPRPRRKREKNFQKFSGSLSNFIKI